jgi:hypothetical protein
LDDGAVPVIGAPNKSLRYAVPAPSSVCLFLLVIPDAATSAITRVVNALWRRSGIQNSKYFDLWIPGSRTGARAPE